MRLSLKGLRKVRVISQALCMAGVLTLLALGPGSATVKVAQAAETAYPSINCPPQQGTSYTPTRQLRGVWIASVVNIDWPSATGLSVATQKQEFIDKLNAAQQMHMNAVFVQIRPTADAFYPSQYAPWSQYLTGTQGQDPGYDPLAFMLEETHKRNLEFHAWFNPYRVSMKTDITQLAPDNIARQHPEWVISYGGKLYFNPGLPEVKKLITDSIMEVVNTYDIDGVHFDDYFYPYPVAGQTFPDEDAYQQYGASTYPNKADWRRSNVNDVIRGVSKSIHEAKPYLRFGISPFGVWRNIATDPTGSETTAGVQDFDDLYADTRTWIKNEWIDYITPQIYWNIGFAPAAYDKLVPWWANEVKGHNVDLYIGQAAYKINANNEAWAKPDEMPNQLAFNLQYPEVKGSIFFSLKDLLNNPLGIKDRLTNDVYKTPALVPVSLWLGGETPHAVKLQKANQSTSGVELSWIDLPHNPTTYYAIYRFEGTSGGVETSAQALLTTVRKLDGNVQQTFVDTTASAGKTYTYYVTALSRTHQESVISRGVTLTVK